MTETLREAAEKAYRAWIMVHDEAIKADTTVAGHQAWHHGEGDFIALERALDGDPLARSESPSPGDGLDVDKLRRVIHDLRWCKATDLLHAIAHDEDDEDGYRARLIEAWALAATEQGERTHD